MFIRISTALLLTATACSLSGCATGGSSANVEETLWVAGSIGNARQLASCIQDDLGAAVTITDDQKAQLLARAKILHSHADALCTALDRYDPYGEHPSTITIHNLRARRVALEEEYRATFREWGIWQVQHGRRAPEDVFEVFDYQEALRD